MKKAASFLFIGIGVLAIIFGIVSFSKDTGSYEWNHSYGGDAYTGIQNASAQTANNIMYMTEATAFGFGAVLTVAGVAMIAFGLKTLGEANEEDQAGSYQEERKPSESILNQNTYSPLHVERYEPEMPSNPNTQMWWTCQCGKLNHNSVKVCQCGAYHIGNV